MDRQAFLDKLDQLRRQQQQTVARFPVERAELWPILDEDTQVTTFDFHYVYHTAWAARRLKVISPARHTDFGSAVYFAAIASAIAPIDFYDYRPAPLRMDGVRTGHANLLDLGFLPSGSLPSVSCMHVVEHVGLGRYGDPVDYDGDLRAMRELSRVVAPGGSLLFVVPMGRTRLVYNAHRVYSYRQIVDEFVPTFSIADFALITDRGELVPGAAESLADQQAYGCGCFHFVKA